MTIKLNDPQIEAIFLNEFEGNIEAFTKYIKESLLKKKQSKTHHLPHRISFKKYKINSFKRIQNPVKWQKEIRNVSKHNL